MPRTLGRWAATCQAIICAAGAVLAGCQGPAPREAVSPTPVVQAALNTAVPVPPTAVPTATLIPPPPTATSAPPTVTPAPPTATPAPPTPTAEPTATPIPVPRAQVALPIVMYHYTGPLPTNPDALRRDLTVSPQLLEDELAQMRDAGVQTVDLDAVVAYLRGTLTLPDRAAVLTFDDGYVDNYEQAFPLLRRYGMVGTFYIVLDFVGRPGYMSWDQLREMAAGGMSIQAHSASHADLSLASGAALERQLVEPKRRIEEEVGRPVLHLAYPSGRYNQRAMAAAAAAGYSTAVTTNHGTVLSASRLLDLPRVRARGADTAAQLVARMTPIGWRTVAGR